MVEIGDRHDQADLVFGDQGAQHVDVGGVVDAQDERVSACAA